MISILISIHSLQCSAGDADVVKEIPKLQPYASLDSSGVASSVVMFTLNTLNHPNISSLNCNTSSSLHLFE